MKLEVMLRRGRALAIGASLAAMLSGCAELNSIHRRTGLPDIAEGKPGGEIITVDAKQRHLLISPEYREKSEVKWRICAEAAPDVFSAYAASGAAEGGSDGQSVSAKFGFSGSETAATIERTQSINLLRESMYRTCERYLSGAINKTMFITQAARDQRAMIAFLAIEQLTRAARPPSTMISGPATAASIRDGEAAAAMIEAFRKEADAAKAASLAADADLQKKNAGAKCLTQDEADKSDDADTRAKLNSAFAECLAAKALKAGKDGDNKQAQARLDQALKLGADTVRAINAASEAGTISAGGGGAALSDAAIGMVAGAIADITTRSNINESLMFCIGYLSERQPPEQAAFAVASTTQTLCEEIVKARSNIDNQVYAESLSNTAFTGGPAADNLIDYLSAGGEAQRALRIARVREALRYLKRPAAPKDVVLVTSSGDVLLQAAVMAFIKAKYPGE